MKFTALLFCLLILLFSCKSENDSPRNNSSQAGLSAGVYPIAGLIESLVGDSLKITPGYGSDLFPHPTEKNAFYLLTDRGPNYDYATPDGSEAKGFAVPDFTPAIGLFRLIDDSIRLVKEILLKGPDGLPLSGLPNLPGKGGTNEAAFDLRGELLDNDPNGIDPEGLVVMEDGSFWVSDEYGPYLMRFDSSGVLVEKFSPFEDDPTLGNNLPKVLANRRPNRGMEGLTITPDGHQLVGIMQSSLYNPGPEVKTSSRICRIVSFDLETSTTRQYAFVQEAPALANSAICALSNTRFLLIERDGAYPAPIGAKSDTFSRYKQVVEINLEGASDISDPENGELGLTFEGQTIEELKDSLGLAEFGITPVQRRVVMDLLSPEIDYTLDKAEGLVYLAEDSLLGIVNDNDFGIDSDGTRVFQKRLPKGERVGSAFHFIKYSDK